MVDYYKHNEEEYKNYIRKYGPSHNQNVAVIGVLLKKLKRLRFKNSVMEVGVGYGVMIKEVMETFKPRYCVGIDLSMDQIKEATRYLADYDVSLMCADIISYEDIKHELVFCSTVLSHIPPEYIEKAVKNVCALSKRHIVIVEPTKEVIDSIRRTNDQWLHDYKTLFSKHKWKIKDKEGVGGFPLLYMRFGRVK